MQKYQPQLSRNTRISALTRRPYVTKAKYLLVVSYKYPVVIPPAAGRNFCSCHRILSLTWDLPHRTNVRGGITGFDGCCSAVSMLQLTLVASNLPDYFRDRYAEYVDRFLRLYLWALLTSVLTKSMTSCWRWSSLKEYPLIFKTEVICRSLWTHVDMKKTYWSGDYLILVCLVMADRRAKEDTECEHPDNEVACIEKKRAIQAMRRSVSSNFLSMMTITLQTGEDIAFRKM